MSFRPPQQPPAPRSAADAARLDRQLDMAAWGLCFVWIGTFFLNHFPWSWCMLGIGAIFLGEAAIRSARDLPVSGVSVAFGILFLGGGLWQLYRPPWPLVPVLFVLFGLAMIWRAATGSFRHRP